MMQSEEFMFFFVKWAQNLSHRLRSKQAERQLVTIQVHQTNPIVQNATGNELLIYLELIKYFFVRLRLYS